MTSSQFKFLKLFLPEAYLPKSSSTFVRFYSSIAFKGLHDLAFLTWTLHDPEIFRPSPHLFPVPP